MNRLDILHIAEHLTDNPAESIRTVLHQGSDMNLVLWQLPLGGILPPHRHPAGEDIWVVLKGCAEIWGDDNSRQAVAAGDSVVIDTSCRHGLRNTGEQDCVLLSVLRPQAGFETA
ncbi:cupin domain-containing protein [Neisseria dumasiana]|uniref:Mannose-1-phosphate guanylyltransferase n=1 Tax=Neisseria dumasiana TaxID=1931275 RepID=A0ABX3WJA9_9NEIS|nr:cupin domain-containing protein [Neisseria dumasiana]OSI32448.1 mannose-1-phosphate guanylyltransferase [Neisseria dumasiana]UOO85178.1 cupin domain-containing protein [Neisseria dumasiana]